MEGLVIGPQLAKVYIKEVSVQINCKKPPKSTALCGAELLHAALTAKEH